MLVPVLPSDLVAPLVGYLVVANLLTLGLFALRYAESGDGEWGRNETRLLFLAVMGGWPGAELGRMLFRPEKETKGFGLLLNLSIFLLPVVVALPYIVRGMPGSGLRDGTDQTREVADAAQVSRKAAPAGEALPKVAAPVATEIASQAAVVPPPRPADLAIADAAVLPMASPAAHSRTTATSPVPTQTASSAPATGTASGTTSTATAAAASPATSAVTSSTTRKTRIRRLIGRKKRR